MAFFRFSRDKRGNENFYLVESTVRRGKSRTQVLYLFHSPPNVRVGRQPFDDGTRRALESRYPDIAFDWKTITETPIPSADTEKWRERRRVERALKQAARDDEANEAPVDSDDGSGEPGETAQAPDGSIEPEALSTSSSASSSPAGGLPAASTASGPSIEQQRRKRRRRRGRRTNEPTRTPTSCDSASAIASPDPGPAVPTDSGGD